jgi:hypothetical protein
VDYATAVHYATTATAAGRRAETDQDERHDDDGGNPGHYEEQPSPRPCTMPGGNDAERDRGGQADWRDDNCKHKRDPGNQGVCPTPDRVRMTGNGAAHCLLPFVVLPRLVLRISVDVAEAVLFLVVARGPGACRAMTCPLVRTRRTGG